jgi:hypothetical protein
MAADYFSLFERRAHCSVLVEEKLYVWGGVTTEHIYPAAPSPGDDDSDSESDSDDSPGPSSPTLVKLRKLLPDPKDNFMDVFDTVDRLWRHYPTMGNIPPPDYGSTMRAVGRFIFLFGAYEGLNFSSDLYRFSVDSFEWVKIEPATVTRPLRSARVGMVDHQQLRLCLFGGVCSRPSEDERKDRSYLEYHEIASSNKAWGWSNEYCEFDIKQGQWEVIETQNSPPPCGGVAFVRFDTHRAISFGGRVGADLSSAFFVLDLSSKVWSDPISPPGEDVPWPIPRTFHTLTCLLDPDDVEQGGNSASQKILLLWGKSRTQAPSEFADEVWILESGHSDSCFHESVKWTRVRLPLFPRSWHTAVPRYRPHSTMLYVLGGNTPATDDPICMVKPFQRKQRGDFRNLEWGPPLLQTVCLNTIVSTTQGHIQEVCKILPESLALLLRDHVRKQGYFPILRIQAFVSRDEAPVNDGSENTQFMTGL